MIPTRLLHVTLPLLLPASSVIPACHARQPPVNRRPWPLRAMSSSEEAAAKDAAKAGAPAPGTPTIFDKIINKEIPADVIYEDSIALAFRDISPQTHFLVIPKAKGNLASLSGAKHGDEATLGHLLFVAGQVAKQEGLDRGYRVVINDGEHGCQSVFHIHLHVLGGRQLKWPPG